MVTKLPHAADEHDEGLQRTPELESSAVSTAVSNSRHHTSSSSKHSNYHTSNKQAMTTTAKYTNEAEAAAAAAAAAVAAKPFPTKKLASNGKRRQAETAIIGSQGNKNT